MCACMWVSVKTNKQKKTQLRRDGRGGEDMRGEKRRELVW